MQFLDYDFIYQLTFQLDLSPEKGCVSYIPEVSGTTPLKSLIFSHESTEYLGITLELLH